MRRFGAFLGVLALLLQMGVPLAHDPLGLGAMGPWLDAPLCHAGGSGGTDQPAAPEKSGLCPICLGLAANACFVAPPAAAGVALVVLPTTQPPPPSAIAPPGYARGDPAQPRGPPALA
jgi:hypothetical protein